MPVFDGVDVAFKVRLAWPDMPIILTGYMPPIGADAISETASRICLSTDRFARVRRLYPQARRHN